MGTAINNISRSTTNGAVLETTIAPLLPKLYPNRKARALHLKLVPMAMQLYRFALLSLVSQAP